MVRRSKKVSPRRYRRAKIRRSRIRRTRLSRSKNPRSRSKRPKRVKTRRRSRSRLRGGMEPEPEPMGQGNQAVASRMTSDAAQAERDGAMTPEKHQEVLDSMVHWLQMNTDTAGDDRGRLEEWTKDNSTPKELTDNDIRGMWRRAVLIATGYQYTVFFLCTEWRGGWRQQWRKMLMTMNKDSKLLIATPILNNGDSVTPSNPSTINLSMVTLRVNPNGPPGVPKNIRTGQVTEDENVPVPVHQVSLVINPGGLEVPGFVKDGQTKLIIAFDIEEDLSRFKAKLTEIIA